MLRVYTYGSPFRVSDVSPLNFSSPKTETLLQIVSEADIKLQYITCIYNTTHHRRVKDASSINMKLQAMALGNFTNHVSVFYR